MTPDEQAQSRSRQTIANPELVALRSVGRAPPEHRIALPDSRRATVEQLSRDVLAVTRSPIVTAVLEVANTTLLVLNPQRQIVAAANTTRFDLADVIGWRAGEAFACVNAQEPGGCGTAAACEGCGLLGAIVACRGSDKPMEAECLLRSVSGGYESFEFGVRATPVEVDGTKFTAVALRDISSEKRRQALEQIFFHDVLNTVCGLRGWSMQLLEDGDHRRAAERVHHLSARIEREIRDHRDLVLAEDGTLVPSPERVRCAELLREIEAMFSSQSVWRNRHIEIDVQPEGLEVVTDAALAFRVLVNMARNALEATEPGGRVALRAEPDSRAGVLFGVHNPGVIAPDAQFRIFQRSFSTKGRGRGLGTYGMKLLGERYLGGEVWFVSSPEAGTTFFLRVPVAHAGGRSLTRNVP